MQLKEYLDSKPYGSKADFAESLGISKTWLSLILNGSKQPSIHLCIEIERLTKRKVKRKDLRPDFFIGA
jgi:hypothetical protein